MCGIFGLIEKEQQIDSGKLFRTLCLLSESRGKEAAGFARIEQNDIKIFKTPFSAGNMVKTNTFRDEILKYKTSDRRPFVAIGHSRLVTNGYEQYDENNQPVAKNGFVVIHNGIIVNQTELWEKYGKISKISDLDSELIPTIINDNLEKGKDFGVALGTLFSELDGMANIVMITTRFNNLFLATNNGSIYYLDDLSKGFFGFASERFILESLIKKHKLNKDTDSIQQLKPKEVVSINLNELSFQKSRIGEPISNLEISTESSGIIMFSEKIYNQKKYINTSLEHENILVPEGFLKTAEKQQDRISELKRCTKCILPETFPFITFDDKGRCNYCNNYKKHKLKGAESLKEIAHNNRMNNGRPECLMPFSGGRDSSYALHYVVKELGLKPIAYSYDWGMITDLARRNQSRMCGKLGVEHILVSADIRKKRSNIRKNVLAWLKRPSLGTVPLFMAGDKQYFYFANQLMKQNNLNLSILGENLLEKTSFKSGFCGVKPNFAQKHTYSLSIADRIKMVSFYGYQFLRNPAYLNSSLIDTFDAFKSYYLISHNNLNIYDYLKWDEKIITEILLNEYDWETDPGTKTTWRIGDGTAAFYNFIYYMIAGFTENDTFRSNQIREGDITREKALGLSISENQPRWDSIHWYCRTIGIDFEEAIRTITKTKSIYEKVR